jgi:hypothetical protein
MNLIGGAEAAKHGAPPSASGPSTSRRRTGGHMERHGRRVRTSGLGHLLPRHGTGLADPSPCAPGEVDLHHGDRIGLNPGRPDPPLRRKRAAHRMTADGKTALITGAARGIGRAFAEAYVREGARVAVADIDIAARRAPPRPRSARRHRGGDGRDRQDSIDRAVGRDGGGLGRIDILINNAALFTAAPIVEITAPTTTASSTSTWAARSSRCRRSPAT